MKAVDLIKRAFGDFQDFLKRPAESTYVGLLKAMAMLGQAKAGKPYPPRRIVGVMTPKRGAAAPIFYVDPAPTRLNRSRKWPEAATYADAWRQAELA